MVRVGVMPGQWGWPFGALRDAWRLADEGGFDLVGCFDHATAAPEGLTAWDAPSLLSAMTAHVRRARLALWVANVSLRHPLLLASQLAVAQAASDGRVEVGLGAGSAALARHDHAALGLEFPPLERRMARLAAVCEVLPRLWRGEQVTDDRLGLHDASLGDVAIPQPPLLIGGRSRAALELAVRHGAAWNAEEGEPSHYAELARTVAAIAAESGSAAPPGTAQVFVEKADGARVADAVAGFAVAGAHTVMLLVDRPDPGIVTRLAEGLLAEGLLAQGLR